MRDPAIVSTIKDTLACGQPYFAAPLLKDKDRNADVIKGVDKVHDVGICAG